VIETCCVDGRKLGFVHIIVENGMGFSVSREKSLGVADTKVFEMEETVGVVFADELDESV